MNLIILFLLILFPIWIFVISINPKHYYFGYCLEQYCVQYQQQFCCFHYCVSYCTWETSNVPSVQMSSDIGYQWQFQQLIMIIQKIQFILVWDVFNLLFIWIFNRNDDICSKHFETLWIFSLFSYCIILVTFH